MPELRPLVLLLLVLASSAGAAERRTVQTGDFRLSLTPRTPEQIGAFYEARGFPKQAVHTLKQQCYLTVYFHNTSTAVIWLDLSNWHFLTDKGEVQRLDRAYWHKHWQSVGLAQRYQSTFRWSLLPEELDYRPDEREGGNLILPYTAAAMRLEARLRIVDERGERTELLRVENLKCSR